MHFTTQDRDHLTILAVCYWVFGGLGIVTSIGLGLYAAFMGAMTRNLSNEIGAGAGEIPELEVLGSLPALIVGFGGIMAVLGIIGAVMKIISGFLLKKRKGHLFILATAGLSVCSVPLGTILGVFTFVVLLRKPVMRAFETGEEPVQLVMPNTGYPGAHESTPGDTMP